MSAEQEPLRTFPMFKGMTRPPMIAGITFGSFIAISIVSVYTFLFTRSFTLPAAIFCAAFAVCYALCQRDPQIFRMLRAFEIVKLRRWEMPSRRDRFWGAKSYAPHAIHLPRSVRRRMRHGRQIRPKASLERWIPAAVHVDPHTIRNKDGSLWQVLAIEGLLVETRPTWDLNQHVGGLGSMLKNLGPEFAVYHHMIRRQVRPTLPGACAEGSFAAEVHGRWQAELDRRVLFENTHYVTVVRRSSSWRGGRRTATRRPAEQAQRAERDRAERLDLERAIGTVQRTLAPYRVRRLGIVAAEDGSGEHSEVLALLSELIQCERQRVRVSPLPLDQYLGSKRIAFGPEVIEIRGASPEDVRLGAILTIKEPSRRSYAGMLDALQCVPYELRIGQSACVVSRPQALRSLKLQQRQMHSAEDDAVTLQRELSSAVDAVASGSVAFLDHHWSALVLGRTAEELGEALSAVTSALQALDMVVARSDLTLEADYWSQIPGNIETRARRALISSDNLACWMSLHGQARGEKQGHWGPPVTLLETTAATPYPFHFHVGEVGHFTVLGKTGSGKTSATSFLLALTQSLPRAPRIFVLDMRRGSEVFLRALGAPYLELRPGVPTGLNFLALDDRPQNRAFQEALLGEMLAPPSGQPLSAHERAIISDAIAAFHESRSRRRRLADLEELLRGEQLNREVGESLVERLGRWVHGDLAWVFGGDEAEGLWDGPYLGIDLTQILPHALVRRVVVPYVGHRLDGWYDGWPTIGLCEEAWAYAQDPLMAALLQEWFKTLRRRNGIIGFCTQSPEDATERGISSAIIGQAATQIWLPNPGASAEAACGEWGLTREEFHWVKTTPFHHRCFLLKQGQESVVVRLDLAGLEDLLPILAGREATVRKLDRLRAQVGDRPSAWLPLLRASEAKEGEADA